MLIIYLDENMCHYRFPRSFKKAFSKFVFVYNLKTEVGIYTLPSPKSGDWRPMEHAGKLRDEWTKLGRFSVTVMGCLAEGT